MHIFDSTLKTARWKPWELKEKNEEEIIKSARTFWHSQEATWDKKKDYFEPLNQLKRIKQCQLEARDVNVTSSFCSTGAEKKVWQWQQRATQGVCGSMEVDENGPGIGAKNKQTRMFH